MINLMNRIRKVPTRESDPGSSPDPVSAENPATDAPTVGEMVDRLWENPRHDAAYKAVFGQREPMADFLRMMDADWTDELDLETLERLPSEHVLENLGKLVGDLAWRVRYTGDRSWQYIHLHFELQSTVDPNMALRMLGYAYAGYTGMARNRHPDDARLFEPIVSIVLHTGDEAWTAKREMAELIQPVRDSVGHLVPRLSYELVEQRAKPEPGHADGDNFAAALLAEGRSLSLEETRKAHRMAWAIVESRPHLKVPYMGWSRYNLHRRVREGRIELPETPDEWPAVWEETVKKFGWDAEERGIVKGEARGIVKGEARGIVKGEAQALDGVRRHVVGEVRDRFGAEVADQAQAFLAGVGRMERILAVHGWALTCQSQTELLDRIASA